MAQKGCLYENEEEDFLLLLSLLTVFMIVSGKSYASEAVWGNDYISETYIVGEQIIRVELSESTRHKRYTYLSTGKVEDIFFDEDWHGAIVYDENGNRSYYSTDIEGNVYCDGILW